MACDLIDVPEYLHWNGRPILPDEAFENNHRVYRLTKSGVGQGNPIEFPQGTYTALSCKWSFIINEEDVLTIDVPPIGDAYKYALVQSFREYFIKREKLDGNNLGWHKLTCIFNHDPKECDYSHCEINIRHEIFEGENEENLIHSMIYTYELWQGGDNLLANKKAAFYKQFVKDYRKDIIRIFSLP